MTEQPDYPKTAWGDESVHLVANPPIYAMAACVLRDKSQAVVAALERLKPAGAKKLHWREMNDRLRKQALEIIGTNPPITTIVVASPLKGCKQERARRKCLESLLVKLERDGVCTLVLEGRNESQNKKDIECAMHLRKIGAVSYIEVKHATCADMPALHIPDQILGAHGTNQTPASKHATWNESWEKIYENVELIDVLL